MNAEKHERSDYSNMTPGEVIDCLDNSDCPWALRDRIKELIEVSSAQKLEAAMELLRRLQGHWHNDIGFASPEHCSGCERNWPILRDFMDDVEALIGDASGTPEGDG